MFPRPSFVLLLCLTVTIAISCGNPQNYNTKPLDEPKLHVGKSIVVNNNCGLTKTECGMLTHIKAKVDYIAAQSSDGSTCPTGWVSHGKSCFLVIDIPTLNVNDARRNCQRLGGDLPKITSDSENRFIHNLLNKQKKITGFGAWLGLYRGKEDKKFYWIDGTPLTGYAPWNTGEPNNARGNEDCVHVHPSGEAKDKWNDNPCKLQPKAISYAPVVLCEKYPN